MKIEYIPTLPVLHELYEKPRDMARFQWYLQQMLGENDEGKLDVVLPITLANPMGREHCLARVNELLAIDADAIAQQAASSAASDFAEVAQTVRLTVTLLDDIKGGWTNRYLTEAGFRLGGDPRSQRSNQKRNFVLIPCWVSENYPPARIRAETRAALYRYVYLYQHRALHTLRQLLEMDGGARAFAGEIPGLPQDELEYTEEILAPYLDSTDFSLQFACLFGDEAARNVGYTPQGLAKHAGFELALQQALQTHSA